VVQVVNHQVHVKRNPERGGDEGCDELFYEVPAPGADSKIPEPELGPHRLLRAASIAI
jgi:hypothetical protein